MRLHKNPCPDYNTERCLLYRGIHCERDICCPYEDKVLAQCPHCGATEMQIVIYIEKEMTDIEAQKLFNKIIGFLMDEGLRAHVDFGASLSLKVQSKAPLDAKCGLSRKDEPDTEVAGCKPERRVLT